MVTMQICCVDVCVYVIHSTCWLVDVEIVCNEESYGLF